MLAAVALASPLGPSGLAHVLTRQMHRSGPDSGAYVADVASGAPVYGYRATVPRVPASVEKLWTTAAVLARYRDRARFTTAVLKVPPVGIDGTLDGDLYLRGGGDPTLSTRDIARLARQVRHYGILRVRGAVVADDHAFDRRRGLAAFGYQPTPDLPPLGALVLDRGQIRKGVIGYQRHPAAFAAAKLERALRARGIHVTRRARTGRTAFGAWAIGAVRSPTVRTLLRRQNVNSDNYLAEMFVKHLGRSTAGGAAVVRRVAERRFGAQPVVVDGSGLEREDTSSPQAVVSLLVRKFGDRAFVHSLAIAGRTGTVAYRLRGPLTYDRCRAKTGTLDDVSALAGYCATLSGRTLAFAILDDGVYPLAAHVLQDRMVTAIARYTP